MESLVEIRYLLVREAESWSVYKALDSVQLINDQGLLVQPLVVDQVNILAQKAIIQWISTSLLGPQVHNGATDLKQILRNIFRFTPEFSGVGIDKEILFLLFH